MSDSKGDIFDQLKEKYDSIGQDVNVHLEGLLHSRPITYWDYIQTDALLNLQLPRTNQPDEMVFIMYHQVNELLFKMIYVGNRSGCGERECQYRVFLDET